MNKEKIDELKNLVTGTVAVAGEEVYQKASKMFMRTIAPSVVVRPSSSRDVAAAIRFVKDNHIPFAIRSGGHSNLTNHLADGIVLIDMSGLAVIEVVDAKAGHVRVGAGALWHEVASELEKHGLGISSGDTRTVGVGGLATGGGLGWGVRKYGPVVDNMLSAEVVTADGQVLEASEDQNADLFWAIRGGGSNFGVVTSFLFKAHAVGGIYIGRIMYPQKDVASVLKGWRDAMRKAPPELTSMLNVFPPMGGGPAGIAIVGCFEGTNKDEADKAYAPFLTLTAEGPVHQEITAAPYKNILENAMLPPNVRVIVHDAFLKEFTDEAVAAIDKICQGTPPILQIRHVAGVMNERAADATAFSHRDSEVLIVNPAFVAPDASEEQIAAALTPWRAIEPFSQGVYLNLLSEDTGQEITEAYLPSTLKRLQKIKAQYDPDNIFNANYNISPAE